MTSDTFLEKINEYPNDYFKAQFAFDCFKGILKKVKSDPSSDHKDFIDQAVLYLTYSDVWIKEGLKELVCVAPKWRDPVYKKLCDNPKTNEVVLDGLFWLWSHTEEKPPSFFWELAHNAFTNPSQVFIKNSYMADRFHLYVKDRAVRLIEKGQLDQINDLKAFDTEKSSLMIALIASEVFDQFTQDYSRGLGEEEFATSVELLVSSSLNPQQKDKRMSYLFDHAPKQLSGHAWAGAWVALEIYSFDHADRFKAMYPQRQPSQQDMIKALLQTNNLGIFERYAFDLTQPQMFNVFISRSHRGDLTEKFVVAFLKYTQHLEHFVATCEMSLGAMLTRGIKQPSLKVIDLMLDAMGTPSKENILLHCIEQDRIRLTQKLAKTMTLEQLLGIQGQLVQPSPKFHDLLALRQHKEISKHISKTHVIGKTKKM